MDVSFERKRTFIFLKYQNSTKLANIKYGANIKYRANIKYGVANFMRTFFSFIKSQN